MDIRIVEGDQNHTPIVAANVVAMQRRNALAVVQVNASGDIVNPGGAGGSGGDGAILDGANSAIKATVKNLASSNPLTVVLVNPSGDMYNANSVSVVVNKWNLTPAEDTVNIQGGRVGVSGDVSTIPKAGETWPVSIAGTVNVSGSTSANPVGVSGDVTTVPKAGQTWPVREQGIVGVQIIGGAVGGTVAPSGDIPVKQAGAWAVAITGDSSAVRITGSVVTAPPVTGVQIVGGQIGGKVGISGDVTATDFDIRNLNDVQDSVLVARGQVGVTGDVSTTPKAGQTWPVSVANTINVAEQNKIGVHVVGGTVGISGDVAVQVTIGDVITIGAITAPVGITGDVSTTPRAGSVWPAQQAGAWAVAVTGDVKLESNSNRILGRVESPIGVQIVGTTVGQVGVSGDVSTTPKAGNTWPVREQGVVGVQIVGGAVGGTVAPSGDVYVVQRGAWATSVTGDVSTTPKAGQTWPVREQGVIGVQIVGGNGHGTIGVSGDVSTTPKTGQTWPVAEQNKIGVHNAGGVVGVSGDVSTTQRGAWATAVTGDVKLESNSNRILGRIEGPLGVQIVGGNGIGTAGISGDVTTVPKAGQTWPVNQQSIVGVQIVGGSVGAQVSVAASGDLRIKQAGGLAVSVTGDVLLRTNPGVNVGNTGTTGDATTAIRDGADATIRGTIKNYTNSKPLAVVLVNNTGDVYSPVTPTPAMETRSGVASWTGSYVVANVTAGKRLYVANYDFQSQADIGYAAFASGASGSQLTPQWILGAREGVAKHISPNGNAYMFRTAPGVGLSLEHVGQNVQFSVSYFTGDA